MAVKRAYHGTLCLAKVLVEGLRAEMSSTPCDHIWLAKEPQNAASSGYVVEVDMSGIPGGFKRGEWQLCYHGGDLGPERLRVWDEPQYSRDWWRAYREAPDG